MLAFHPFGHNPRAVLAVWFSGLGNGPSPFRMQWFTLLFPPLVRVKVVVLLVITNSISSKGNNYFIYFKLSLSLIQKKRGWKESFLPRAPGSMPRDSTAQWQNTRCWGQLGFNLASTPIYCVTLTFYLTSQCHGYTVRSAMMTSCYLKQEVVIAPIW